MRLQFDGGRVFPGSILAPFGQIATVNRNCHYSTRNETLPASVVAICQITASKNRMISHLLRILALTGLIGLGACIDSAKPILTDAQPLIGERPRITFYVLRDGAAREPNTETFAWRNGRYVPMRGIASDIHAFTLHAFEGGDLIVQSVRAGYPAEYAIARKLADGTYLLFAVDENDADTATRDKYCSKDSGAACRVETREVLFAFARASAAKPHSTGGLAVLLADH